MAQGILPEANLVMPGTQRFFLRLDYVYENVVSSVTRPEVLRAGEEVLTMGYRILAVFNPGNIPTIFFSRQKLLAGRHAVPEQPPEPSSVCTRS